LNAGLHHERESWNNRRGSDDFGCLRADPSDSGTSFLPVTHNLDPARRCDRIIEVIDGRIQG
jgi:predicted ABC-type transport system involved in lysophospholipase L1 biosynthesis ATPase subunit